VKKANARAAFNQKVLLRRNKISFISCKNSQLLSTTRYL
jgi:hypothetical protein